MLLVVISVPKTWVYSSVCYGVCLVEHLLLVFKISSRFQILKFVSQLYHDILNDIKTETHRQTTSPPILKKSPCNLLFYHTLERYILCCQEQLFSQKPKRILGLRTQFTNYSTICSNIASYEGARVHWIEISKAHFHF